MNDAQFYIKIAIWSQVVSSVIFLGVLAYMWLRWILPVVMAAQERSNRQIAEAERHRDEVKGALESLHEQVETARHDAGLIEQRAGARAEHERAALLQEATEAGERALADAGRELERARIAAGQRLRDELVERALRVAREEAARRINPAVESRFIEGFTGSLEGAPRG
jgi:F0F1-type ATP synthase membrane subunit b/b'